MGSIRVMLLCDLPLVAWGLQRLINDQHPDLHCVGAADSLPEAQRLLRGQTAHVLLVDLDGDIGVPDISELPGDAKTRVLALTASRDVGLHDEAVLAGASGVICKREPVEVLLRAIEKVHLGEFWLDRAATGRIFMAIARNKTAVDPEADRITRLTRKERLTVAVIAGDAAASSAAIAERLHISEHTLRNHLTSIYAKLGVTGRLGLYAYANRYGLGGRG